MPRPVKATFKHITLFLPFGALATLLSAWIPALIDPPRAPIFHTGGLVTEWLDDVPDTWPPEPLGLTYNAVSATNPDVPKPPRYRMRQGMHNGGSTIRTPTGRIYTFSSDQPNHVIDIIHIGWPTHTMTHRGPDDARPLPNNPISRTFVTGITIPTPHGDRPLPLKPLWIPFAISTLAWGAALFIAYQLAMIPFRIRRAKRIKTRRCATCGYELHDLEICPECGPSAA